MLYNCKAFNDKKFVQVEERPRSFAVSQSEADRTFNTNKICRNQQRKVSVQRWCFTTKFKSFQITKKLTYELHCGETAAIFNAIHYHNLIKKLV